MYPGMGGGKSPDTSISIPVADSPQPARRIPKKKIKKRSGRIIAGSPATSGLNRSPGVAGAGNTGGAGTSGWRTS